MCGKEQIFDRPYRLCWHLFPGGHQHVDKLNDRINLTSAQEPQTQELIKKKQKKLQPICKK